MTDLQPTAAIWCALLVIFALLTRRVIFSATTYGVFVLANIVFVVAGLLALPWARDHIESFFVAFRLDRIGDEAMLTAIGLNVGGLFLTYIGYQSMHFIIRRGRLVSSAPHLLIRVGDELEPRLGFVVDRVVMAAVAVLLIGWATVIERWPIFLHGLRDGLLAGRPDIALEARQAATAQYGFVLLVYNIAPFVSAALCVVTYARKSLALRLLCAVSVVSTAFYLLLVFQKRPLIIYLGILAILRVWLKTSPIKSAKDKRRQYAGAAVRRWLGLAIIAVGLFLVLIGLYYATTQIGRGDGGVVNSVVLLSQIAIQRIFGRLSLPAAMYAEYFPSHAAHYGWANIGLIAKLFGGHFYNDTAAVFAYFSVDNPSTPGSVASSALNDFYGAAGIAGWILGALCLGALLNRIDFALERQRNTLAKHVIVLFAFVFAYYLSQASLARALFGYGGLFFLSTWWILRVPSGLPQRTGRRTGHHSSSEAPPVPTLENATERQR